MFKKFLPILIALVAVLLPEFASATETLKPLNGNAWTLYVFGNGDAIFGILNAIKLLMVPDSGDTGYNSLMMFLATVGFLVLAVQAGFDPGKNLMKMFTYILVVGCVHITTMEIRANILISDPVTNYENAVDGVPALVGVPAAIVSEVGHWFTKTIETYYTIPSELTVSGGTFNLFGRLMQESNEFVIVNPELKKSLSAYTADCVVPAMARGNLTASDLMTAPVMTQVMAKATHKAILTKYWPMATPSTTGTGMSYPDTIKGLDGLDYPVQGGLGAVIPCDTAWTNLEKDLDAHGQELVDGTAKQWAKTGVLVPFETGMSAAMALASNGGANPFANYSKPQGYILQQAFLNSMNGNFRSAAASIGNNDILMSASIAQAEQSQKSSWFTAARVFTNMMGYVYTTLQAFIFAIVPIVIVALMVPGLGRAIFTNYAQILVWLTLWQPMLSIVNFLITLFGKAQISSALELAHGVTMQNKWLLSESTNDMMLAAQFLGTSVPLLTWGLVKGSLAFTEFISHGIGSSMAQQAGATAATGNMSLGNMSMDNTSMNKFNTAMSSAVGSQTTMGYTGSMQSAFDDGGSSRAVNGQQATRQLSGGLSESDSISVRKAAGAASSASDALSVAHNEAASSKTGLSSSSGFQAMSSAMESIQEAYQVAKSRGDKQGMSQAREAAQDAVLATQLALKAHAKVGAEAFGTGIGAQADAGASSAESEKVARKLAASTGLSYDESLGHTRNSGNVQQDGTTVSAGSNKSSDKGWSVDDQRQLQTALSHAMSKTDELSHTYQMALDSSDKTSMAVAMTDADQDHLRTTAGTLHQRHEAYAGKAAAGLGSATVSEPDSFAGKFDKKAEGTHGKFDSSPAAAAAGRVAANPVQRPDQIRAPHSQVRSEAQAVRQEVLDKSAVHDGKRAAMERQMDKDIKRTENTNVLEKGVKESVKGLESAKGALSQMGG